MLPNVVLFRGQDALGQSGLWETDGTASGTFELTTIAGANAFGLFPSNLTLFDNVIARNFQRGVAAGLCVAISVLCSELQLDTVVLSGGVFQNELLLSDVRELLRGRPPEVWTNHSVPSNDGGISLGQAALATFLDDI